MTVVGSCGTMVAQSYDASAAIEVVRDTIDGVIYDIYPDSVVTAGVYTAMQPRDGVVTIPSEIDGKPNTTVAADAFKGDTSLRGVVFPDGISYIRSGAFEGCSALEEINLPSSLKEIGASAFAGCKSVETLTLPDLMVSLGDSAFCDCTGLTSATILAPAAITPYSFAGCTSLKSVTISKNVGRFDANSFADDTSLTDIYIDEAKVNPPVITTGAFNGCSNGQITLHAPTSHSSSAAKKMQYNDIIARNPQIKSVDYSTPTGVEEVVAAGSSPDWTRCDYYTLDGVKVSGSSPVAPGVYIVVGDTSVAKMVVR